MRRVCEGAGLRRELHDELLRGVPRQNLSDDGQAAGCPSSLLARPSAGQRNEHVTAPSFRNTPNCTHHAGYAEAAGRGRPHSTVRCVALLEEERGEGTLAGRRHHHPPPALFQKRMMLVIPPTHSQSCTMMDESNKAKKGCYGTLWRQTALI